MKTHPRETYPQVLAALADPTRRAIFEELRHGPRAVGELARELPVSRPAVSQHLKVLETAELVGAHREGTRRIYRVRAEGLRELERYMRSFWGGVLDAFRAAADGETGDEDDD